MGRRSRQREKVSAPTTDYTAPDGAVLTLRGSLTPATVHAATRRSWYFDLSLILGYWESDGGRVYHHTAPINMVYALREALRIVDEEGLPARWERHALAHERLRRALGALGCERLAPEGEQLHPLLAVVPPDRVDEAAVRGRLLSEHGIEISGGLGPLAGRLWRIGVMGERARRSTRPLP